MITLKNLVCPIPVQETFGIMLAQYESQLGRNPKLEDFLVAFNLLSL